MEVSAMARTLTLTIARVTIFFYFLVDFCSKKQTNKHSTSKRPKERVAFLYATAIRNSREIYLARKLRRKATGRLDAGWPKDQARLTDA